MRIMRAIAAICFVGLGCGDDGGAGSPAERLEGHWVTTDRVFDCLYGFSFRADGLIEFKEICDLTDGSVGIVLDAGWFEADEDSFTWDIEESSCDYDYTQPITIRYEIDGDELTLWVPEGVLILERLEDADSGGGGFAEFGCFDDEGFFDPMPVGPIKARARRKVRGPITRAPGWGAVAQETALSATPDGRVEASGSRSGS